MTAVEMDPRVREMWVEALRSGKFAQTTGVLHNDEGLCCLGVLCELAVQERVITPPVWQDCDEDGNEGWAYGPEGSVTSLPEAVLQWAGIPENNGGGDVRLPVTLTDADTPGVWASAANDVHRWTFAQIADAIEGKL